MRAFGNLQLVLSVKRRNHDFRPQSGLGKGDRHDTMDIVAFALEKRVLLYVKDYVQVPGRPSERARLSQASEANACAVFHSRGHLRFYHALAKEPPLSLALGTRIRDDRARSLAYGTSTSNAEESLLIPNLPPAIAGPARDWGFTGGRTRSVTQIARLVAPDFHLLLGAKNCLVEFQVKVFPKISTPLGTAAPAATLASK